MKPVVEEMVHYTGTVNVSVRLHGLQIPPVWGRDSLREKVYYSVRDFLSLAVTPGLMHGMTSDNGCERGCFFGKL